MLGAVIDLKKCLNLVERNSLSILKPSYNSLKKHSDEIGNELAQNKMNNRGLDCQVIEYIHHIGNILGKIPYDTVRCAFPEGEEAYPGSSITSRLHIQVCVRNHECIKAVFLPQPWDELNAKLLNVSDSKNLSHA